MSTRSSCPRAVLALGVCVFLLTSVACGVTPSEKEAALAGGADVSAQVDAYAESALGWFGIPGMSIAVISRGEIIHEGSYGVADTESGEPMTDETLYQLSSTSGLISATALMTLVDDGFVSLDGSVGDYVSDAPEAWRSVTVRQLLSRTSGLPGMTGCGVGTEEAAVRCALGRAASGAGSEESDESQTDGYLVQKIIERASGESLPEYVARRVFEPAGVTGVVYEGSAAADVPGRASTYLPLPNDQGGMEPWDYAFPPFLYANAGLNASVHAVATWLHGLESGTILSPGAVAEMWRPVTLEDGIRALGWDVGGNEDHPTVGHLGGPLTTVLVLPEDSVSVVLLMNGSSVGLHADGIADEVLAVLDPGFVRGELSPLIAMRQALRRSGVEEALEVYRVRAEALPADVAENTLLFFGSELSSLKLNEDAVAIFEEQARSFPDSWVAHALLGEMYIEIGNEDGARDAYRRSLELDPDNEEVREALSRLAGE